ncbi:prolactin-releasing peptide [Sorex araneus]|uniref:prolactin-releasing peptide n=1 Tax=Sorex araneus TaxID=42254 RepID=UPI002433C73C|nr:prolactin-releasing peptide [Sorex araneus]
MPRSTGPPSTPSVHPPPSSRCFPARPPRPVPSMQVPPAVLLCLLLGLALGAAASRGPPRSMEIHAPDIDVAWYRGRGIRPVGRFGRRRDAPGRSPPLAPQRRWVTPGLERGQHGPLGC